MDADFVKLKQQPHSNRVTTNLVPAVSMQCSSIVATTPRELGAPITECGTVTMTLALNCRR